MEQGLNEQGIAASVDVNVQYGTDGKPIFAFDVSLEGSVGNLPPGTQNRLHEIIENQIDESLSSVGFDESNRGRLAVSDSNGAVKPIPPGATGGTEKPEEVEDTQVEDTQGAPSGLTYQQMNEQLVSEFDQAGYDYERVEDPEINEECINCHSYGVHTVKGTEGPVGPMSEAFEETEIDNWNHAPPNNDGFYIGVVPEESADDFPDTMQATSLAGLEQTILSNPDMYNGKLIVFAGEDGVPIHTGVVRIENGELTIESKIGKAGVYKMPLADLVAYYDSIASSNDEKISLIKFYSPPPPPSS